METMRESWTDERLDDFRDGMAEFRRETKEEFATMRLEMREEFRAVRGEMQEGFGALNKRFDTMQGSFDAMQRTMIQVGGGMATAFGAALVGLIATQL